MKWIDIYCHISPSMLSGIKRKAHMFVECWVIVRKFMYLSYFIIFFTCSFIFHSFLFLLCFVTQLCLNLCDSMYCSLPGSSVPEDSPGKNTGVGCHAFLQGIFPTQGLNSGLLHCRWTLYHLNIHQIYNDWVYPIESPPTSFNDSHGSSLF